MILTFENWLIDQQYRKDPIGELARVPSLQNPEMKAYRRKGDEHKNWATIVINMAAGPGFVEVFNEAWQEFLLAKQAAQNSLK
ncbi:MAG: hypothetical protein WAS33_06180 [Candidatus Promineifilaceae bacterium]|jgi:cytochrome c peroxidase|nr:hypothetical protein [Anaerolineaceae bacterium]